MWNDEAGISAVRRGLDGVVCMCVCWGGGGTTMGMSSPGWSCGFISMCAAALRQVCWAIRLRYPTSISCVTIKLKFRLKLCFQADIHSLRGGEEDLKAGFHCSHCSKRTRALEERVDFSSYLCTTGNFSCSRTMSILLLWSWKRCVNEITSHLLFFYYYLF